MSTAAQRHLLRTALVAFALADVLVWVAFVLNQWFAASFWESWGIASVFALPVTMLLLPIIDSLLSPVETTVNVPKAGHEIPRAGQ